MSQFEYTHRRKNPLTGDWVLVSPHRNNRPWLGATEQASTESLPSYVDDCPLCPGNNRANDTKNPDYQDTFVFVNDFGALNQQQQTSDTNVTSDDELFTFEAANGECRVVCFSPDHSKTMPELSVDELTKVVTTWRENYQELASKFANIHIFENKGEIMGCSQPHPHGQIWAHQHASSEIAKENSQQADYYARHQTPLLANYIDKEVADGSRVICSNEHWIAVVPFWAAWPFETLVVAREDIRQFGQINDQQAQTLASLLKELTTRYDNVFNCSFPYSMGWHSAPTNLADDSHWRLHAHFYPPLLRSATVKKHMVGYEMMAESQRDLSAETAAAILQKASTTHYKQAQQGND
ncbi:UDP-glucose--hexose-1-phosphate uridylyltransferase [Thalassotalea euphylliae]|uniref:Galactose-1-phosphate uridylyltransferase n=1 Tax=Thalassotalea euphylliae TaxID=1655234 RepID=A0A3E0U3W5_9GAMM|nr:UDP-glucose--hexose-1-phosphate uridylyltransferase [Thalassotalea euphylliae]REL30672.1 UDP-glucose--hexose-1-phosphate uridylyltransferase [Thalassotalea euphylliae]